MTVGATATDRDTAHTIRLKVKQLHHNIQFIQMTWTQFDVFVDFCFNYFGHTLVSVKSEWSSLPPLGAMSWLEHNEE